MFARHARALSVFMDTQRHKEKLSPILSATVTYNFAFAKSLDEKLKPLSVNRYTITDIFSFAEEIQNLVVDENGILVSYDVPSQLTNVPFQETIEIIAGLMLNF